MPNLAIAKNGISISSDTAWNRNHETVTDLLRKYQDLVYHGFWSWLLESNLASAPILTRASGSTNRTAHGATTCNWLGKPNLTMCPWKMARVPEQPTRIPMTGRIREGCERNLALFRGTYDLCICIIERNQANDKSIESGAWQISSWLPSIAGGISIKILSKSCASLGFTNQL